MSNSLKKYEISLGCIYALLELLVLPQLAVTVNDWLQLPVWLINCILYILNFVCLCAIFHRFLLTNLEKSAQNPWRTFRFAGLGLLIYYLLTLLISYISVFIYPDYVNLNDTSVSSMVMEGGVLMVASTIFLVPVSEELLFRGLLFRGIYERSPVGAWIISTVSFSLVHIIGYIGIYEPIALLLAFIQYLPAGICLAFAYQKADTIIAPILIHITINQIGISLMR